MKKRFTEGDISCVFCINFYKLSERFRDQIISVFKEYVDEENVQLYLYGSRATGREHDASDIDIAVKSSDMKPVQLSSIREALHESHIPYKIDLINLTTMDKSFGKKC